MARRESPGLLEAYVWATEVNLATLEELLYLKSSSQVRIRRQKGICLEMLKVCQEYGSEIEWGRDARVGWRHHCGRVNSLLKSNEGVAGALDAWVSDRVNPF